MSRSSSSSNRRSRKLDLKLNLSLLPSTSRRVLAEEAAGVAASPHACVSSPSSCLTTETTMAEAAADVKPSAPVSPEATSMVLAGCPRCLMYVMISEDDLKCPRCSSTVLLDFFGRGTTSASASASSASRTNKHNNKKTRMS